MGKTMNAQEFAYWLQGWMELENPTNINQEQTQMIKDHLALVFKKETPIRPRGFDGNPANGFTYGFGPDASC